MPGPTSRDTYIGRSKGASLGAAHERAAETMSADHPSCRVCRRPMVCGQATSNQGAHYLCAPPPGWSS